MKNSKIIYHINSSPFLGENQQYHYLYRIINLSNGKEYIGVHSTKNLNDNYSGSGKRLRKDQEKYGMGIFIKLIEEFFETENEMFSKEGVLVDFDYIIRDDTYNLTLGGKRSSGMLGRKHTEETKKKQSLAKSGIIFTESHKKHISLSKIGNKNPNFGKRMSEESRRKLSISISGENHWDCRGSKNSFYGKHHSKETIEKLREINIGRIPPNRRKVMCIDTGKIFESATSASKFLGLGNSAVSHSISKNTKCGGYHWKYI